MYLKYQDRFSELEDLGNVSMGRFMLNQVLSKMQNTCKECMRDRMRCTLRPLCPDRIFLNMLIMLGASISDLPSFCYQVHIRNLESYLKAKAKRKHPKEPRFPLRYFRRFIKVRKEDPEASVEAFTDYLEEITQSPVHSHALKDQWFFGVGDGLFIVDLKRQTVSLDPEEDIVHQSILEPLITFLAEMLELEAIILKDLQDIWYLRITFPYPTSAQMKTILQPLLESLETYWSYVTIRTTNQETQLLIGLDPAPNLAIRYQMLRNTMQLLSEIDSTLLKAKEPVTGTSENTSASLKSVARGTR